jgi:hypothetical protein
MKDKLFSNSRQAVDMLVRVWGSFPLLLFGSIMIDSYIHGDLYEEFNLTRGDFEARFSGISFILHTLTGLLILFFPLHRKIFGILSISMTITTFLFVAYFNRNRVGVLLFGVFFESFFLLLPSLYILHSAFGRKVR